MVAHGHSEIRLAEVQGLGYERESGVGDDRTGTDEIGEEAVERRLFVEDVPFVPLTAETIGDEAAPNSTQELGQRRSGRGYVYKYVVSLGGSGVENFLAQQRRKQERIALANRCSKKRDHEVGVGAGSHQFGDEFRSRGISAVLPGVGDDRISEAMLVVDGDDRKAAPMPQMAGQRLEVGDDQIGVPFIDEVVETGEALGGLRHSDQIPGDGALVADAVVHVGEAESVDLGDIEL